MCSVWLDIIWLPYSENVYFNVYRRLRESSTCCRLQNGHGPSDGVAWWIKWPSESFGQSSNSRPGLGVFLCVGAVFQKAQKIVVFENRIQKIWLRFLRGWWTWFCHIRPLDLFFAGLLSGGQTLQGCLDKSLLFQQIMYFVWIVRICCRFS